MDGSKALGFQDWTGKLIQEGKFTAAVAVGKRAVMEDPGSAWARSNLGVALIGERKYEAAATQLKHALRLAPKEPDIWHNYVTIFMRLGLWVDALKYLEKVLEIDPKHVMARIDRAQCLLALCQVEIGLAEMEARWEYVKPFPTGDIPPWQGEDVAGKNILVWQEQGLGDGIMLIRFVPNLIKMGAKVTLAVNKPLEELFVRNFRLPILDNETDTIFDYQVPLLSLMRWLGPKRDFGSLPYLTAESSLNQKGKLVGICWQSGNFGVALADRQRKVPLELFIPLTSIPGVSLVSLQKPITGDIYRLGFEQIISDPMMTVTNFVDTAEIMAGLDFVVTVDSAVAHLAGAMGKPTIMLSPYQRCWRWWGETNGLPWYENFTIVKQNIDGSWNDAMKQAHILLEAQV